MCHPLPTECFSLSMFNTGAPYHSLLLLKLCNSPFYWNHNFYCRKLPCYLLQVTKSTTSRPNQSAMRRLNCTKFKGRREMEQIMGLDLMGPWAFFKRLNKHHLHEVFMKWGLKVEESWWHNAFVCLFMDAIMYRHIDGYVYVYIYVYK